MDESPQMEPQPILRMSAFLMREKIAKTKRPERKVSLHFKQANCVVVGTFNIYILQPSWFVSVGVLEQGDAVHFRTDFSRPGFKFSSTERKLTWLVRPDRLIVETDDHNTDCGEVVAEVFQRLPHTPFFGIGNNAEFEAPLEELGSFRHTGEIELPEPPGQYTIRQKTWHVALHQEPHVVNVQIAAIPEEKKVAVSINTHTELQGKPQEFREAAARLFLQHRTEAIHLFKDFFGVEVSYDNGGNDEGVGGDDG